MIVWAVPLSHFQGREPGRGERDGLLTIDENSDSLLLVTCYPFNTINLGEPLRLVVTAER